MLDLLGLTQLVGSPTRDNNLLDILASTSSTLVTKVAVDDVCLISDQLPRRHCQLYRLQYKADSHLVMKTSPECRSADVQVRDP